MSRGTFGELNLNQAGSAWLDRNASRFDGIKGNPLLVAEVCGQMVADEGKERKIDYPYGGYLEDRSKLLTGSYLEKEKKFLHLGVDFSVPTKTPVAATFNGRVVHIDNDFPEEHGWGTRIIIWDLQSNVHFIFAHLDRTVSVKKDGHVKPGEVIGTIGAPPINGGWWPHLHLQVMTPSTYADALAVGFEKLDGYGLPAEKEDLRRRFPDPMNYLR